MRLHERGHLETYIPEMTCRFDEVFLKTISKVPSYKNSSEKFPTVTNIHSLDQSIFMATQNQCPLHT